MSKENNSSKMTDTEKSKLMYSYGNISPSGIERDYTVNYGRIGRNREMLEETVGKEFFSENIISRLSSDYDRILISGKGPSSNAPHEVVEKYNLQAKKHSGLLELRRHIGYFPDLKIPKDIISYTDEYKIEQNIISSILTLEQSEEALEIAFKKNVTAEKLKNIALAGLVTSVYNNNFFNGLFIDNYVSKKEQRETIHEWQVFYSRQQDFSKSVDFCHYDRTIDWSEIE